MYLLHPMATWTAAHFGRLSFAKYRLCRSCVGQALPIVVVAPIVFGPAVVASTRGVCPWYALGRYA